MGAYLLTVPLLGCKTHLHPLHDVSALSLSFFRSLCVSGSLSLTSSLCASLVDGVKKISLSAFASLVFLSLPCVSLCPCVF